MKRFRFACALSLSLAADQLAGIRPAAAQAVSDADRRAARDLYQAGSEAQKAGKFAEALDAFQRSFSVFEAPTTALRVAQCQAALGHLVEAEEDYRALGSAKIPEGSPEAFTQAQQAARVEMAQVTPRIPSVKIVTTPLPSQAPGLTVTIDGQPMNVALVGASRPVNPGSHKIVASAPGFVPAEQMLTIQERETRDVALVLRRTAGAQPVATATNPAAGGYAPIGPTGNRGPAPPVAPASGAEAPYRGVYARPGSGSAPYTQATRRESPGLYGGGIALVVVGSIGTLVGLGMMSATDTDATGAETRPYGASGAVVTLAGIAAIVGGSTMIIVGGRRVPVNAQGAWMPLVKMSPTGATAAWTF